MDLKPSYWDHQTYFKDLDTVIIGSGITGLSAAYYLKKNKPEARVLVLERGPFPYGASTRNAGFACFGSMSEILADIENESPDAVFSRIEDRYRGLLQLRQMLGDSNIGFDKHGGYEVFNKNLMNSYDTCMENVDYLNNEMSRIFGRDVFTPCDNRISEFGFSGIEHMILNSEEGQIDTGAMMQKLSDMVRSCGVQIISGVEVNEILDGEELCEVFTSSGLHIRSRSVIIAVNGFAKKFLDHIDLKPARSQVMVTQPIDNLAFKGTFHYDRGYTYFRNIGSRVLIGGGRNMDIENENTEEMNNTEVIMNHLHSLLNEHFLPGKDIYPEFLWSGIMGTGSSKSPIIEKTGTGIYCAVRLGGMGVAIGATTGEKVAGMVMERLS